MGFHEIGEALSKNYYPDYNPTTLEMPYFLAWILSFFMPELKSLLPRWGKIKVYDNLKTREVLGI